MWITVKNKLLGKHAAVHAIGRSPSIDSFLLIHRENPCPRRVITCTYKWLALAHDYCFLGVTDLKEIGTWLFNRQQTVLLWVSLSCPLICFPMDWKSSVSECLLSGKPRIVENLVGSIVLGSLSQMAEFQSKMAGTRKSNWVVLSMHFKTLPVWIHHCYLACDITGIRHVLQIP